MAHDRSRRPRNYQDLESHSLRSPLGPGPASPGPYHDRPSPTPTPVNELGRKKSLTAPNRMRMDRNHPNYHYRQHAQQTGVDVYPSTTGNDPIIEDNEITSHTSSESNDPKNAQFTVGEVPPQRKKSIQRKNEKDVSANRLSREARALERKKEREAAKPLSAWTVYCNIVTFWAPGAILKCFGMPTKPQQSAWREKMGLISIILCIAAFVGFLTFGFTQVVCGSPTPRLRVNNVDRGFLIIHGRAYNLGGSTHIAARGIPHGANVLYDLPIKYGGMDASFMFQNVNGHCKGLLTPAPGASVPTDNSGNMGWYFPCKAVLQDGSSKPNATLNIGEYYGYACHTSAMAREAYFGLKAQGDVYFTWDDIKNSSRNLVVYSGNVIDLDLMNWFNRSEVNVPKVFDEMRDDNKLRGVDITHQYQSSQEKKVAKCLSEIARVGSIDTETVGCIASKVVLYVSLVFIVSIVAIKFVLALFFSWFLSWRLGATRDKEQRKMMKKRMNEIEDWADDINRPAPKLQDPAFPDRRSKRQSFLPATSRFTSPYHQGAQGKGRSVPTTMSQQSNQNSRLLSPGGIYSQGNGSRGSLSALDSGLNSTYLGDNRASAIYSDEGPGPAGFIHEAVVPQPPSDYQPFGYPLAHTMCLITCYSEGELGIRTTLDSIATTDYPNSHKLMVIICDGLIKGSGETLTTPQIILGMMKDHAVPPEYARSFSYVAVASGSKRHNMAQVYAGFYDYGDNSMVPLEKQQRVPVLLVVKCGTEEEKDSKKPGNRGKRDSQIILMSFLQKVMFDERMTELEFEMFNGIWKITGISPDYYETVLMVDADTKVFPDSLTHMVGAMVHDPEIMGLCGETKIANKRASFTSMIQVFEYFISHHLTKAFESVFGGVTCLPGCFCMYRIKAPKGGQNYWVPILANPDVVEHYSENIVETLHDKNLLLLGEDRYLSTLMLRTFPKRKQIFVPQAVCKTIVPDEFQVLLSQRRRWINSTVHNLMELVLVRDLCGTFCFSMQFVVFIELVGTVVLPAAIAFTLYLIIISIYTRPVPVIPLILLGLILGLPAILIVLTAHRASYILWMLIYLLSLPIWNFVLPVYAFWKFDDFSWGETRKVEGEINKGHDEDEGLFDSSMIVMKRWGDFEKERRLRAPMSAWAPDPRYSASTPPPPSVGRGAAGGGNGMGGAEYQIPPVPPMPGWQGGQQQQGHQHRFSTSDGAATEYGI